MSAQSLWSCVTLCDPKDCSPPGSSVHGILQAKILDWVAVPTSRGSYWPRNRTLVSCGSCIAGIFFITEQPVKSHKRCRVIFSIFTPQKIYCVCICVWSRKTVSLKKNLWIINCFSIIQWIVSSFLSGLWCLFCHEHGFVCLLVLIYF